MTYDDEVNLIKLTTIVDAIGDIITIEIKRNVLVSVLNYRNKDYYEALAGGLKPSITFGINKYEYEDEKHLEYNGKKYKIIDITPIKAKDESEFESIGLICEGVLM